MKPKRKPRLIRPRAAKTDGEAVRIGQLEARQAELEARIARLEQAPFKEWPDTWPKPFVPREEKSPPSPLGGTTCSKCGMVWQGIMGYVCSEFDCPMGAGPTWCGTKPERATPIIATDMTFGGESMRPDHLPNYHCRPDKTQS